MKKVLMIALLLINTVYAESTLCSANDEVVFSCDIKRKNSLYVNTKIESKWFTGMVHHIKWSWR